MRHNNTRPRHDREKVHHDWTALSLLCLLVAFIAGVVLLVACNGPSGPAANPLAITTTSLPSGTAGVPYPNTALATSGGSGKGAQNCAWGVSSGFLPAGLVLSSTGIVSGIPNTAGTFNFTVQATDSLSNPPGVATKSLSITIAPAGTLTITTTQLPAGALTVPPTAYSQTLNATGGVPPYNWSIANGSLPAGIALNSGTGVISGTPTAVGTSTFTVQVTDSASPLANTATQALSLTINGPLTITTTSLPNGQVGTAYSQNVSVGGGTPAYVWSITKGTLPLGLTLNASTGVISGTPTTAGSSNFTVQVMDSSAPIQTQTQALSITINPAFIITTTSLPNGTVGTLYSQTIQATGGTAPYTWSVSAGVLPNGLGLDPATGLLSGNPSAAGMFNFTVQATDSSIPQKTAIHAYQVVITNQAVVYSQKDIFADATFGMWDGAAVALDDNGDIAVVAGGPRSGFQSGAPASVFVKGGTGTWSLVTTLNVFGVGAVAISADGSTIVVGICSQASGCGSPLAYVFVAPNANWPQGSMNATATLDSSNCTANNNCSYFGYSVAVDATGDTVAVGAPGTLTTCPNAGCPSGWVFVYHMAAGTWTGNVPGSALLGDLSGSHTNLGVSVSIDAAGDTVAAGGTHLVDAAHVQQATPGFLDVFLEPAGGWPVPPNPAANLNPHATLTLSSPNPGDSLGSSVAISSDGHTIVAGAEYYPCPSSSCAVFGGTLGKGAAFIFVNPNAPSAWATGNEQAILTASNGASADSFGYTASISDAGDTIIVGAPGALEYQSAPYSPIAGQAYVFDVPVGGWSGPQVETQKLVPSPGKAVGGESVTPSYGFGAGVSISGDHLTLGVGGFATVNINANQGVTYVFE